MGCYHHQHRIHLVLTKQKFKPPVKKDKTACKALCFLI